MASNDTYAGALEVLAKQLATMRGLVDANLPFVDQMFQMVTDQMRSPEMAMQKAGIIPGSGQNPQGMGAPGMPGPGMGGPGMPGPGGMSAPPPTGMGGGMPGGPPTSPAPDPAMIQQIMGGMR